MFYELGVQIVYMTVMYIEREAAHVRERQFWNEVLYAKIDEFQRTLKELGFKVGPSCIEWNLMFSAPIQDYVSVGLI